VKGLKLSGFMLNNENDSLVWSWDHKGGTINAKQAYEVQCLVDIEFDTKEWTLELWKWHIPLRLKLFVG
jgi:hypothetical protein